MTCIDFNSPVPCFRRFRKCVNRYGGDLVGDIGELLETARHTAVRAVNSIMTANYWQIGRRIVKFEQSGDERAEYGTQLLKRLSTDLNARFRLGISRRNPGRFRSFYLHRRFQSWWISNPDDR